MFENRVIRYTLERIGRLPLRSQMLRARVRRVRKTFSGVSVVPVRPRDIERHEYDRLTRPYEPIHGLCRLLLEGAGLDADAGARAAAGFFVDMNALFEDFVARRLQGLARPPLSVQTQMTTSLDRARHIEIRPDIVLFRGRRPVLVADTKYKRTDGGQVPNADVYQALAYARALEVRTAYLLYPAWEEEPRRLLIRDSENVVVIDTVPLAGQPAEVDASVAALFESMKWDAVLRHPGR